MVVRARGNGLGRKGQVGEWGMLGGRERMELYRRGGHKGEEHRGRWSMVMPGGLSVLVYLYRMSARGPEEKRLHVKACIIRARDA
eukprot:34707-Eustigmatos_ZCMA.PRE.1